MATTNVGRKYDHILRRYMTGIWYKHFKFVLLQTKVSSIVLLFKLSLFFLNTQTWSSFLRNLLKWWSHLCHLYALFLLTAALKEVWYNLEICNTSWRHLVSLNRILKHISHKMWKIMTIPTCCLLRGRETCRHLFVTVRKSCSCCPSYMSEAHILLAALCGTDLSGLPVWIGNQQKGEVKISNFKKIYFPSIELLQNVLAVNYSLAQFFAKSIAKGRNRLTLWYGQRLGLIYIVMLDKESMSGVLKSSTFNYQTSWLGHDGRQPC